MKRKTNEGMKFFSPNPIFLGGDVMRALVFGPILSAMVFKRMRLQQALTENAHPSNNLVNPNQLNQLGVHPDGRGESSCLSHG